MLLWIGIKLTSLSGLCVVTGQIKVEIMPNRPRVNPDISEWYQGLTSSGSSANIFASCFAWDVARKHRPAHGMNGSGYGDVQYMARVTDVIEAHDTDTPLFFCTVFLLASLSDLTRTCAGLDSAASRQLMFPRPDAPCMVAASSWALASESRLGP